MLLRELCNEARNPITSIAALMGLWFARVRFHKASPQPPIKAIACLIMQAAFGDLPLSVECAHRLWNVFVELVAIEHGNRMDVMKEREAIAIAGQVAAEIDHKQGVHGDKSLWERLNLGFVAETSESEAFKRGYDQYRLAQAKISRKE